MASQAPAGRAVCAGMFVQRERPEDSTSFWGQGSGKMPRSAVCLARRYRLAGLPLVSPAELLSCFLNSRAETQPIRLSSAAKFSL